MARIRSVKPELRTDLTVAEWPREVRYAWVLLLGYLDDHGRGRDDSRLVVADLFPLDRDVTERKINLWLDRMAKSGPLCRYEVDGQHYMHAVKWTSHQKISHPTDSRLPPCPVHDLHEPIPSPSGDSPEPDRNDSGAIPEPLRPSRTRADQGTGNEGAGNREQGSVEEPTAQTFVAEWIDHCNRRPPGQVVGQVAKHVGAMLAEGIDPTHVRAGLALWHSKALNPSALPSVVNEVMNAPTRTTRRTTDDKVRDGLSLAQRLAAEEQPPDRREIGA